MLTRILREKKAKASAAPEPQKPTTKIQYSAAAKEDFKKYKGQIGSKMADFITMKSKDPMAPFGSTDRHFTGGPLAGTGIIHAHLNHDVQVLYRRSGRNPTVIEILRIGSHDDFGTGQPSNQKVMKNLAKQVDGMVTEAKGNVLNDQFMSLRTKFKEFKTNDGEAPTKSEMSLMTTLKHIKDREVWETGGPRAPSYGPALSNRVSATREVILQKRSPDGKIVVAQRSDTLSPGEDSMSRTFANTEQGYQKALTYYISLTR